jgi:hypothetical protein
VCVLEKNTREFVRELREVEEEEALQAAAPTSIEHDVLKQKY